MINDTPAPRGITLKDPRIVAAEETLLELANFYYRSEWEDFDFKGMTKAELDVHATEQEAVKPFLDELSQLANDYEKYCEDPREYSVENRAEIYREFIDEIVEDLAVTLKALEECNPTSAVERQREFLNALIIGTANELMQARNDARGLPPC